MAGIPFAREELDLVDGYSVLQLIIDEKIRLMQEYRRFVGSWGVEVPPRRAGKSSKITMWIDEIAGFRPDAGRSLVEDVAVRAMQAHERGDRKFYGAFNAGSCMCKRMIGE